MSKIRQISLDQDYKTLSQWWEQRGWPVIPQVMLSPSGFMANEVCACFLYKTDSPIMWLEWTISDPKSDKSLRDSSLDELLSHCERVAKVLGFQAIFTSTNHNAFGERLKKHEFTVGDSNMTTYIRRL